MSVSGKECGWVGMEEDCIKVYETTFGSEGGGEAILECPKCSSENLIGLMGKEDKLEPVLV